MTRPEFSKALTPSEFKKYYWYKSELQEICRNYRLPTYGTKYELEEYICAFLAGKAPAEVTAKRKRGKKAQLRAADITPATKVLESGFSFNQEARKFFAAYYGVDKFSFRKTMAARLREIEATQDEDATVQDLIAAYEQKEPGGKQAREEGTYQWNNFVRDFRRDPASKQYNSPMKVAALLWRQVRDSDQDKRYSRRLLIKNGQMLADYKK